VIIFSSIRFLPIKNNQTGFYLKKTEIESNQPVSVWFGSVLDFKKLRKPMPHFLNLVTIKQNKLSKILFEIELVLFEKRNKLIPYFLSLVTIKQNKLSKTLFEIELV